LDIKLDLFIHILHYEFVKGYIYLSPLATGGQIFFLDNCNRRTTQALVSQSFHTFRKYWIPACAGMTQEYWIPWSVQGMTEDGWIFRFTLIT